MFTNLINHEQSEGCGREVGQEYNLKVNIFVAFL